MTRQPEPQHGNDPTGPETWVREAIAEQEEHLKRIRACSGVLLRPHTFRSHATPGADGTIRSADVVSRCIECGVTETPEDYRRSLTRPGRAPDPGTV